MTDQILFTIDPETLELIERKADIIDRVAGTFEELPYGGMIVMSTDINSNAGKSMKEKIKSKLKTWYQRWIYNKASKNIIKDVLQKKGLETGFSIGVPFNGHYYDKKNNVVFEEKSFAIEILGSDKLISEVLYDIADVLAKEFNQQSILIKDYTKNKIGIYTP